MSALALPDPQLMALAEVRGLLVPMAEAARANLRASGDVAGAQDLIRRLEAFRTYLRDREAQALVAAETRRTEVLIGELLGPAPNPATSRRTDLDPSHPSEGSVPRMDRSRFRTLAEQATRVEELLASGVVSRSAILDALRSSPRAEVPTPTGKFHTIVADPPWRYGNAGTRGNAAGHYDGTLSVDQLCGRDVLPDGSKLTEQVESWSAEDAHLYLWTTAGFLREAFEVMDSWGFEYKTFLVWVKPQMGMGNYFRVSSEMVLFGIRGRQPIDDRGLMNWFQAKRGKHSAKPHKFYDLVAKASPGPHLEMFSRCYAEDSLPGTCHCTKCARGWEVWGNEA